VDFGGLEVRRKTLKDHQRIYDAIAARNAPAAREAMEAALQDIIDYSLRMKGIEDRSEFQAALGLVRESV
jgi:DNA-binding FadR family transcriptional regulator